MFDRIGDWREVMLKLLPKRNVIADTPSKHFHENRIRRAKRHLKQQQQQTVFVGGEQQVTSDEPTESCEEKASEIEVVCESEETKQQIEQVTINSDQ